MAGLKYKVGHENLLFSLRMFSFFLFRVGRGLFLFSLESRLKVLYIRCFSFETSSELNSETRSRYYKNICYVLWMMPLINLVRTSFSEIDYCMHVPR